MEATTTVIAVISGGTCTLISKIIWDWLKSSRNGNGRTCKTHDDFTKNIDIVIGKLDDKVDKRDDEFAKQIEGLKLNQAQSTIMLKNIDTAIEKLDGKMEKRDDEIFFRLGQAEKEIGILKDRMGT